MGPSLNLYVSRIVLEITFRILILPSEYPIFSVLKRSTQDCYKVRKWEISFEEKGQYSSNSDDEHKETKSVVLLLVNNILPIKPKITFLVLMGTLSLFILYNFTCYIKFFRWTNWIILNQPILVISIPRYTEIIYLLISKCIREFSFTAVSIWRVHNASHNLFGDELSWNRLATACIRKIWNDTDKFSSELFEYCNINENQLLIKQFYY